MSKDENLFVGLCAAFVGLFPWFSHKGNTYVREGCVNINDRIKARMALSSRVLRVIFRSAIIWMWRNLLKGKYEYILDFMSYIGLTACCSDIGFFLGKVNSFILPKTPLPYMKCEDAG